MPVGAYSASSGLGARIPSIPTHERFDDEFIAARRSVGDASSLRK
jgi:hypothetical protein